MPMRRPLGGPYPMKGQNYKMINAWISNQPTL